MADENDDEPATVLLSTDEDEDGGDEDSPSEPESEDGGESERDKRRRIDAAEASSSQGNEDLNFGEIDGLVCPVCMEPWTDDGDHHICCLPCGHIYGMSCINRWLKQRKNQGKCPQCNRKCTLKDVKKLFATRLVAVDEKLQKRIRSLEAKCASHEKKRAIWKRKEAKWRKLEVEMQSKFQELTERTTHLEGIMGDLPNGPSGSFNAGGDFQGKYASGCEFPDSIPCRKESCHFMLQDELQVDGAHLFDVDTHEKILLIARSLPGTGAKHVLTKMSLIQPHEREDILLPPSTNLIKDLHFSPSNDGLALFTSLGKKLSLLSTDSNSVVLSYDLPAAGWTCSWDLSISHYGYAGLQNGSVFMFDKRQTRGPVKFLKGKTSNPVHTIHSISNGSNLPSSISSVLSASSAGLCQWNFEGAIEGPTFVPETDKQGVCISLAYCRTSDDIVASYRPKAEMHSETPISLPSQTHSQVTEQGIIGSHIQYRRVGNECFQKLSSACASVSQIRLPKCAIIDIEDKKFFATGDESSCDLVLQDLPSFTVFQRLSLGGRPIRDIKYTNSLTRGLLGCLSGNVLQVFGT